MNNKKRDQRITLRVNADEKSTLELKADLTGLDVSTYLRLIGLDYTVKPPKIIEVPVDQLNMFSDFLTDQERDEFKDLLAVTEENGKVVNFNFEKGRTFRKALLKVLDLDAQNH